jgi:SAM-dependent methyltransferase
LNLGVTDEAAAETLRRRSNVARVIYDDMTQSILPDASFDCVLAVEVLEHVAEDVRFVGQVRRVLKPGGFLLMSTPNGDFVRNRNPDHVRHYHRSQLESLLRNHFDDVSVWYAIRGSRFRKMGLRSWSLQKPLQTVLSAFGNIVNGFESQRPGARDSAGGFHHLLAIARKRVAVLCAA